MSKSSDQQWQELLELFQVEAAEHLGTMNRLLVQLETQSDISSQKATLQELFRAAHSLKGAARTVDLGAVEQVAHAIENVFDAVRNQSLELTPDVADVLYDGLDSIGLLLKNDTEKLQLENVLESLRIVIPERTQESSSKSEQKTQTGDFDRITRKTIIAPQIIETTPPFTEDISHDLQLPDYHSSEETIRVNIAKLDTLMIETSNLLVARMNVDQRVHDVKAIREQHHRWQKQWRSIHTHYIRLIRSASRQIGSTNEWKPLLDFLQQTQQYMQTVGRELNSLEHSLNEDSFILGYTADALQTNVRDVRLLPFDTILGTFQRSIRDLSRELGKAVMFRTVGTRIELDKQILENIKDPLIHIFRNALDHGIEIPETRQSLGKPDQGLLLLSLMQRGNKVHILISDDGKGIDTGVVLQKALELGLVSRTDVGALTDIEIYELLMQPGMSTSTSISEISGRGVGLDVVRQKVEALQGQIRIESHIGQGTSFEIILPISLSTLHCVMVQVSQETYAIPTSSVARVVEFDVSDVFTVEGQAMLTIDDRPVPLAYLEDVLEQGHHQQADKTTILVLVLEAADRRFAFVVDDIVAEQEAIVRSLNPEMARVRNVSGATLLANGKVVIILNVSDLIKSAQGKPVRRRQIETPDLEPEKAARILVVDDSITTRTLQKNILEAAGYEVMVANHGMEALDKLSSHDLDLVITDVEMPWMNGFELTIRIRKHPKLKNLPVVLVTSLDSQENKRKGFQAGADAYIVKGVFDQNELLNTITTLL
jgi:two-component system chemotaxis sensor kinase CheA